MPTNGVGNITNAPLVTDLAMDDLHLLPNSPCINAGKNIYASDAFDFDGNARVSGGTVDIGAYEFQSPTSKLSYQWAELFGFSHDGSADLTDPDQDGLNNWQEWVAGTNPTNLLSTLIISSVSNSASGLAVTWESVDTRNYFLERATNMAEAATFSTLQTNIVGQSNSTTFTDLTATNVGPFFYRVGIQQ